jgi:transposase
VGTRQTYSKDFKDAIVVKVLNRGDRTIAEVCGDEGVAIGSINGWMKESGIVPANMKRKKWSAEEKLDALSDTRKMPDAELGVYLRKAGLHSLRLTEWRADVLKSLDGALAKPQAPKKDERDLKIKDLEREILRKDKALAEASALLILQKKVHLIWERSEEEKK